MRAYKEDLKLLINFILCICSALLLFLISEGLQRGKVDTLIFISEYKDTALLNYLVALIFVSPALLFKRTHFAALILAIPWGILAGASALLLEFRGVPLIWADIYAVDEGAAMAKQYLLAENIIKISIGALIVTLLLVLFFIRFKGYKVSFIKRLGLFLVVCIAALLGRSYLREPIVSVEAEWDVATGYKKNGFMYSFTESYLAIFRKAPQQYSRNNIAHIIEEVAQELGDASSERPNGTNVTNIIMVQLEGFFDPTTIKAAEFNEDPIPRFREYFNKCYNGYLQVPTIGGGTVRTEFEVLSGMNLDYLAFGELPYNSGIISKEPIETIAYTLKENNYRTTAIHNFEGNFYSRNKIFKHLGFDRFISMETMIGLVKYRIFPEDMVLLDYIKKALDTTVERDFVFTIAVGSHGPYPRKLKPGNEHYVSGNIPQDELHQLQNYTSLIRRTDQFVGALADYVYSLQEPTMLVIYSDHYPRLDSLEKIENEEKFSTPYFILDNQNKLTSGKAENLEAYQLSERVLSLSHLQGGIMNAFHKVYAKREDYQENLELLQYDMLFGKKYAMNDKAPYQVTEATMGLWELKITKVSYHGDRISVKGEGFTESSKLFVDNQPIETVFVDESSLIGRVIGENTKTTQVKLLGRHNLPLAVSNIFLNL